ncbi:HipA N-terminal domain-containing protein [Hymenobacter sp. APR13]|uniref:HipA N-terminal domain-containing protein n=1 Tax=Hymenobacter sp. APR13 TaxID=1356852 RepID=UPI000693A699|nr:HipA N-terminal domain-containing protein [Hymenobacter sp. APR13]
MRRAEVRMRSEVVGHLTQDEQGYTFAYTPAYRLRAGAEPVSLTLPLWEHPWLALIDALIKVSRLGWPQIQLSINPTLK